MPALISEVANACAFGRFLLFPGQQLLLENEEAVRIGRRAFDVLAVLVQERGQVVGKRELMARAWPGVVVEEGNLKVTIAALRQILGEDAGATRYIATVVGRGYRFIAPVRDVHVRQAARRPPGNLPQFAGPVYGREAIIAAIVQDLHDARLVSIVGPGGVGKTTVAIAAAHRGAGAWFVDLSMLADPSQVPAAILPLRRETLLVLDNCEHLVGAVAQCADRLLTGRRNVRVLVTSREPLNIRGERVRRLAGLGLPPDSHGIRAVEALAFPSVQLFADRAAAQYASFTLDDTNAPAVAAICRRLDGHALAIERVAARAGALGAAGLLDHLDRRFHMLDGFHTGPARHRTLTATVDASYVLLSPGEQAILRRLSVFAGAFSLDAACASAGDIDRATAVDDIANLVAKSLLLAEPADGAMQYRLGQVTRAYAAEKRAECDE